MEASGVWERRGERGHTGRPLSEVNGFSEDQGAKHVVTDHVVVACII